MEQRAEPEGPASSLASGTRAEKGCEPMHTQRGRSAHRSRRVNKTPSSRCVICRQCAIASLPTTPLTMSLQLDLAPMTDEHEWRANCAVASASTTISRPGGCNPRTSAAMAHHGHACNCETGLNPEPLQRLLRVEASGGYKRRWNYVSEIQRHGMDASWRQKMCRWMFETGQAFDLMADTVASAIHCMDQYLSVLSVDKIMLQLVSMVCMYTASKMHESYPISMEELELLCEHKFSRANIRLMEAQLLQVLDWKLNPPVPHIFARDFIQLLRLPSIDHQRLLQENVLDFLQLVLEDYASLRFKSSSLAIAAVQLFYQLQYPQAEPGAMLAVLSHLDVNATELIESFRLLRDIYRAEVAVHIQRQP